MRAWGPHSCGHHRRQSISVYAGVEEREEGGFRGWAVVMKHLSWVHTAFVEIGQRQASIGSS